MYRGLVAWPVDILLAAALGQIFPTCTATGVLSLCLLQCTAFTACNTYGVAMVEGREGAARAWCCSNPEQQ
jgi:hypothetical protein